MFKRLSILLMILVGIPGCAWMFYRPMGAWREICTNSAVVQDTCFLSYMFFYTDDYGHYEGTSLSFSDDDLSVVGTLDPNAHSVIRFGTSNPHSFDKSSSYESDILHLTDQMKQEIAQADVAFLRIYPWPTGIQEVAIPLAGLKSHLGLTEVNSRNGL